MIPLLLDKSGLLDKILPLHLPCHHTQSKQESLIHNKS